MFFSYLHLTPSLYHSKPCQISRKSQLVYSKSVKRTLNISIAFLLAFIVFSPVAWTENTCLFKDKNTTYKSDGVNIISVDKENYKDIWINGTLTYIFRNHSGYPGPFLIFKTDKEYCFNKIYL